MIVAGEVSACPTANGQCQIGNFQRVSRVGQHFRYQNIQVIAALGFWQPNQCKLWNYKLTKQLYKEISLSDN